VGELTFCVLHLAPADRHCQGERGRERETEREGGREEGESVRTMTTLAPCIYVFVCVCVCVCVCVWYSVSVIYVMCAARASSIGMCAARASSKDMYNNHVGKNFMK